MTRRVLVVDHSTGIAIMTSDPVVYIHMGYEEVEDRAGYWAARIEDAKAEAVQSVLEQMEKVLTS